MTRRLWWRVEEIGPPAEHAAADRTSEDSNDRPPAGLPARPRRARLLLHPQRHPRAYRDLGRSGSRVRTREARRRPWTT